MRKSVMQPRTRKWNEIFGLWYFLEISDNDSGPNRTVRFMKNSPEAKRSLDFWKIIQQRVKKIVGQWGVQCRHSKHVSHQLVDFLEVQSVFDIPWEEKHRLDQIQLSKRTKESSIPIKILENSVKKRKFCSWAPYFCSLAPKWKLKKIISGVRGNCAVRSVNFYKKLDMVKV